MKKIDGFLVVAMIVLVIGLVVAIVIGGNYENLARRYKHQIDTTNTDLDAHCKRELEDYRSQLQECESHFNDVATQLFRCAKGE